MKAIETLFTVIALIWAFWTVAPTSPKKRAEHFCAPATVVVKIFGAFTRLIDPSTGDSLASSGATSTGQTCRVDVAPQFLNAVGLVDSAEFAAEEQADQARAAALLPPTSQTIPPAAAGVMPATPAPPAKTTQPAQPSTGTAPGMSYTDKL
jgi:hypothetical protein